MIGKTVSHYRILEQLGAGGMGVVYKAEDTKLGRPVALKFLPPELTRDEDAKTRFIHEARAASALQHHNICTIHEIDETSEGQLFIAMDCYQGETLKEKIARGQLSMEEAVDIAAQVAAGLSKAHEAGMVHRDVKPANIMVTSDGVVKLLDFGLAKLAGQTKLTKTGTTVGTVSYMSPEQARGEEVDARSDIFSLGAVFYEMITGAVPFPGDHEAAVLYGIINGDPKQLVEVDKSLPQDLQRIIDRALKKDPKERYQNVIDLGEDLDAVSAEIGKGRARGRGRSASAGAIRNRTRKKRIIATAAAIAVVAVLGSILITRLWRSSSTGATHALAVMDFRDLATPDDPLVSVGITELVNIGLIEADLVRVVSSDLLHDLRRRLFGSPRGAIEESQTIEIARKAGATLFLTGSIRPSGTGKIVTWHLVDAKSGDDVKAGREEGDELAPLADQIIAEALPFIVRRCGVEAAPTPTEVESITTENPRAYQHYVAGVVAAEEITRKDDAIREFERAVSLDSNFALSYIELGRMYWGAAGYVAPARARGYFERAWGLRSRLGIRDQMRLKALRQDLDDRAGDGIITLREMHERWPDDRQILRDLGEGLFFRWYFSEALVLHEEGRQLYPDDIVIGGPGYLSSLVALGRTEDALRATRSYLKRHPSEPNSWDELGLRCLALGFPDSAEAAYQKAVELDPNWLPESFSFCAYHRGDLMGAINGFENMLTRRNLNADRRKYLILDNQFALHLAALYIEAGCFEKAHSVCRTYIAPADRDLGHLLLEMGETKAALDLADQLDKELGIGANIAELRGKALVAIGDLQGARAVAKKLLESEFEWGGRARYEALQIQAEVALAEHNAEEALDLLNRMKQNGIPFGGFLDIRYRTTVARAYRMAGRLEDAANVHKEMLRVYGGHALSYYELGTIYEEMNHPADAKKEYAKFLEMWSEADEGLPQLVDVRERLKRL